MRFVASLVRVFAALDLVSSCAGVSSVRAACSQLVIDRIDPLNEPGVVPATYQQQFAGGNGLNATIERYQNPYDRSTCTSCEFADDFSNYWMPTMYYQSANGSFMRIKQLPSSNMVEGENSGLTVWYTSNRNTTGRVSIFPQGFRVRHGNPQAHEFQTGGHGRFPDLTYVCDDMPDANNAVEYATFPVRPCKRGIITRVVFPECWDGKNIDGTNHEGHVAFTGNGTEEGGLCPSTHPVMIPQLKITARWDTSAFNAKDLWGWRGEGKQPFLWSNGDREGWSLHANFMFGWRGESLRNNFTLPNCPGNCTDLYTASAEEADKCKKAPMVPEKTEGWLSQLPGGVQPWS